MISISSIQTDKQSPTIQRKKCFSRLRIQKDIQQIIRQNISFIKLQVPDAQQVNKIFIQIYISECDSVYFDCLIKFRIDYCEMYPIEAPKIYCLNKVYHPKINVCGWVDMDLVRLDYSPVISLRDIIDGLRFMFIHPFGYDPLVQSIGNLMIQDYQTFRNIVKFTVPGGMFRNVQYDKIKCQKQAKFKKVFKGRR